MQDVILKLRVRVKEVTKSCARFEGFKNVDEALKNRQTVRWLKELAQIELKTYLVVLLEFREEEV